MCDAMRRLAKVAEEGLEPPQSFSKKTSCSSECGAEHGALGASLDSDLATVVEVWHNLPDAVRAGVMAMVKASIGFT